ncbi:MAG: TonB-dependent receptor, partial [Verrucomicrobiae bacterium]|nr:TonB-dependent receptor [Verrucomicrobiae bacterium]
MLTAETIADTPRSFSVEAGEADVTLKLFAKQAMLSIVYDPRSVADVETNEVVGRLIPEDALARMLEGTPLVFRQDLETGAFAVTRIEIETGAQNGSNSNSQSIMEQENDKLAEGRDVPIRKSNALERAMKSFLAAILIGAPGGAMAQEDDEQSVYELNPFEIQEGTDIGYIATATLAGSRLNTSLLDTPASISVMTQEFLSDIGAADINEAIEYGLSAGNDIGGGGANVGASTGNGIQGNEFNFQIRGYRNVAATRDYFTTNLAADMYNVERVEVARGPNSLIFGIGGPGGIVNVQVKSAILERDFTRVRLRTGSWNEQRGTIDYNKTFGDGKYAIRFNGLVQEKDGWKDFAKNDQLRGALAFTGQITDSFRLKIQSDAGKLDQNRVRPWGPVDQISSWEDQGSFYIPYGTPESPALFDDNNYSQTRAASGGNPSNNFPANIPAGQTFERRTAHIANPTLFMMDGPLAGKLIYVGQRNEGKRYYRTSFHNNLPGYNTPAFIDDESLYPRSGNIMGPGALNTTEYVTVSAIADFKIGDNFNINLTAARSDIYRRQNVVTGFAGIAYKIDVTTTLPVFNTDGTYAATGPTEDQGAGALNFDQVITNPNVGDVIFRYSPSYTTRDQLQDDIRASFNYNLDLDNLGFHRLLGFLQSSKTSGENKVYAETNVHPFRQNRNTWFSSTNYAGRTVHIDPFSADLEKRGAPDPWKNPMPDSILYGGNPGDPTYYFQAGWVRNNWNKSETQIDSAAVAIQSEWFGGNLITTIGGRRDEVSITNWSRVRDSLGEATGLSDPTPSQDESGDTYSVGAVYHMPFLEGVSLFANKSTNFQPQGGAQYFEDEALRPALEIGALKGTGEDYGLKFELFDKRIFATIGRFDVSQSNASTGYDGNVTSYINAIWTTILNGGPQTDMTDAEDPNGHRVGGRDTRDQTSEGWEFELTANPTDNWRVSFNLSKSDNTVDNLGNNVLAYVDKHRATWEQYRSLDYDTGRSPGFLGNNKVGDLIDGLDRLINFMKADEGLTETNIRPWNANLFTAYNFTDGALGGLTLG